MHDNPAGPNCSASSSSPSMRPLGKSIGPARSSTSSARLLRACRSSKPKTRSGKFLRERIGDRGRFPDSNRRLCTSDLKRGPIERELRHYFKDHPQYRGLIVNASLEAVYGDASASCCHA